MPKGSYKKPEDKLVNFPLKVRPEQKDIVEIVSGEQDTTPSALIRDAIDKSIVRPYKRRKKANG